ncbi:MAG: cyclophilin-like fold protein [Candidatus Thorarchaeota archaeon]
MFQDKGMPDLSDTDLYLNFEFEGNLVLEGYLNRVHAPLLVEEIKFKLPFEGKTALMRSEMQITLGISKGYAKPTTDVKKGDISYMPLGDALCIYLEDQRTYSKVNILGKITSSEEEIALLKKVRRGSQVHIKMKS